MTSEKQAKVNRRNALESTGPKTSEGKAVARYNATKHGLLSREVLLPGEDEEALKELGETTRAELQPAGDLENLSWTGWSPPIGGCAASVGWKRVSSPTKCTES